MINEIWEGLRLLPFFFVTETGVLRWKTGVKDSGHAPPHPRPYDGPCFCRISAPSVPPGRAAWPAPPSRPGAIAPRRVPCGGLMAVLGTKGMRRHENCPACPGRPPAGLWPPGLVVVGAWWCGAGPAVGRRRSAPVSFRRRPKRGGRSPPARLKAVLGAGPGSTAGRPPCGLAVPPWRLCGRWGRFCRPGWGGQPLACPGPSPLGGL